MSDEPTYEAAKADAFARLAEALADGADGTRLRPLANEALRRFAQLEGTMPWLPPFEHTRDLVRAALVTDDAGLFREITAAYESIEFYHWELQFNFGVSREDRAPVPTAARMARRVGGHANLNDWTRASPEDARRLDAWCAAIQKEEAGSRGQ